VDCSFDCQFEEYKQRLMLVIRNVILRGGEYWNAFEGQGVGSLVNCAFFTSSINSDFV
jgi:hypothetical protein